jgi:hypothetical protein
MHLLVFYSSYVNAWSKMQNRNFGVILCYLSDCDFYSQYKQLFVLLILFLQVTGISKCFVIMRGRKSKFINTAAHEAGRCLIKVRQIRICCLKYILRLSNEYSTLNDNFSMHFLAQSTHERRNITENRNFSACRI